MTYNIYINMFSAAMMKHASICVRSSFGFSNCQVVNPDIVQLGFRKGDAVDAERARKWMSLDRQGALLTPENSRIPLFTVFSSLVYRGFPSLSCVLTCIVSLVY